MSQSRDDLTKVALLVGVPRINELSAETSPPSSGPVKLSVVTVWLESSMQTGLLTHMFFFTVKDDCNRYSLKPRIARFRTAVSFVAKIDDYWR